MPKGSARSDPVSSPAFDLPFRALPDLIREHARARPQQAALVQGDECIGYAELDRLMDRVAASLQRDGLKPGDAIALCAQPSPRYGLVFLGALRAGVTSCIVKPFNAATLQEKLDTVFGKMGI